MSAYFENERPRNAALILDDDNDDDDDDNEHGAQFFFSKFRSGRRGRFRQKIFEIGVILAIFEPFEV